MTRGKYIIIEGSDGSGKSTQAKFLRDYITDQGKNCVILHEPGDTKIGAELREIIINKELERSPQTNLLLFTAARHELLPKIMNHLDNGDWVIASRNWLSTVVYQGYGEGVDIGQIQQITAAFTNNKYLTPDATIILHADDATRQNRLKNRDKISHHDNFESKPSEFQAKLTSGYKEIAMLNGYPLINTSSKSIEQVNREIIASIDFLS